MSLSKRLINTSAGGATFLEGQAALAISTDGVYTSYDYGVNWSQKVSTSTASYGSVSTYGTYMIYGTPTGYYLSSDAGNTFSLLPAAGAPTSGVTPVCRISGSGQYILVNKDTSVFMSQDFGATFTQKFGNSDFANDCDMTGTGQHIYVSVNISGSNWYFASSDYGSTWTDPTGGINYATTTPSSILLINSGFGQTVFWTPRENTLYTASSNNNTSAECGGFVIKKLAGKVRQASNDYGDYGLSKLNGESTYNYVNKTDNYYGGRMRICGPLSPYSDANTIGAGEHGYILVGLNNGTILKNQTTWGVDWAPTNAPSKVWLSISSNRIF